MNSLRVTLFTLFALIWPVGAAPAYADDWTEYTLVPDTGVPPGGHLQFRTKWKDSKPSKEGDREVVVQYRSHFAEVVKIDCVLSKTKASGESVPIVTSTRLSPGAETSNMGNWGWGTSIATPPKCTVKGDGASEGRPPTRPDEGKPAPPPKQPSGSKSREDGPPKLIVVAPIGPLSFHDSKTIDGSIAETLEVRIRNGGKSRLAIKGAAIVGKDAGHFKLTKSVVETSLAPSETMTMSVSYVPNKRGVHAARLALLSDDAEKVSYIDLGGSAQLAGFK